MERKECGHRLKIVPNPVMHFLDQGGLSFDPMHCVLVELGILDRHRRRVGKRLEDAERILVRHIASIQPEAEGADRLPCGA